MNICQDDFAKLFLDLGAGSLLIAHRSSLTPCCSRVAEIQLIQHDEHDPKIVWVFRMTHTNTNKQTLARLKCVYSSLRKKLNSLHSSLNKTRLPSMCVWLRLNNNYTDAYTFANAPTRRGAAPKYIMHDTEIINHLICSTKTWPAPVNFVDESVRTGSFAGKRSFSGWSSTKLLFKSQI